MCCQTYDRDEDLQADYDEGHINCETCPLRLERERLTYHDRECLELHRLLSLPVVRDLRLTRLVFEVYQPRATPDEADALLDKLQTIHEHVSPPPERPLRALPDPARDDEMDPDD